MYSRATKISRSPARWQRQDDAVCETSDSRLRVVVARYRKTNGLSLLEVIIATTILTGSTLALLRLIAIGDQHRQRGERSATAQVVCQSIVDQWLIDPTLRQETADQPVPGFPGWTYSAALVQDQLLGIDAVRIQVFEAKLSAADFSSPNSAGAGRFDSPDSAADSAIPAAPPSSLQSTASSSSIGLVGPRPVYEIVRWMPAALQSGSEAREADDFDIGDFLPTSGPF